MAVTKKYDAPLQVVATSKMRDEIRKASERDHVSQAAVIRDILSGRRKPVRE